MAVGGLVARPRGVWCRGRRGLADATKARGNKFLQLRASLSTITISYCAKCSTNSVCNATRACIRECSASELEILLDIIYRDQFVLCLSLVA